MNAPPDQRKPRCRANGERGQGQKLQRVECSGFVFGTVVRSALPVNFPRWMSPAGESSDVAHLHLSPLTGFAVDQGANSSLVARNVSEIGPVLSVGTGVGSELRRALGRR